MKTILRTEQDITRLLANLSRQPLPFEVTVREYRDRRSEQQSRKMWAMLHDVARQVKWHGMFLSAEDWKTMATAALKRQRVVPGIEGGFVVLGTSTRKMTMAEMSDVIEFLFAFGAERGVRWSDPADVLNSLEP